MKKLERADLRLILGGASASADCGNGLTVSCSGTYACSSEDGHGCSCDDGNDQKLCPVAIP